MRHFREHAHMQSVLRTFVAKTAQRSFIIRPALLYTHPQLQEHFGIKQSFKRCTSTRANLLELRATLAYDNTFLALLVDPDDCADTQQILAFLKESQRVTG